MGIHVARHVALSLKPIAPEKHENPWAVTSVEIIQQKDLTNCSARRSKRQSLHCHCLVCLARKLEWSLPKKSGLRSCGWLGVHGYRYTRGRCLLAYQSPVLLAIPSFRRLNMVDRGYSHSPRLGPSFWSISPRLCPRAVVGRPDRSTHSDGSYTSIPEISGSNPMIILAETVEISWNI